ncbi:MAG: NYN domain-containing protein [Patescibacteria group bacterium]
MAGAKIDIASTKILAKLNGKKTGLFIDDSNLYHGYKKYHWRIDLRKLKALLETHSDLKFINYHIGIPAKSDESFKGTENYLEKLKEVVTLRTKPLKYTRVGNKIIKKADVDVEIVLDVVRSIDELDVVIVMTGDSDYLELKNYVTQDKRKVILFMGYEENMAWELRQCWHLYLNRIKEEVVLSNKQAPGKPGVALL